MGWFTKLSAKVKLLLAFVAVAVMLSGVAGYSLYEMGKVTDSLSTLRARDLVGVIEAYECNCATLTMGRTTRHMMGMTDPEILKQGLVTLEKNYADFQNAAKRLEPTLVTDEGRASLAEVKENLRHYYELCHKCVELVAQNKLAESKVVADEARPWAVKTDTELRKTIDIKKRITEQTADTGLRTYQVASVSVTTAIGIGIAMSLFFGWLIARWFGNALIQVSEIADSVSVAAQQLAAASEELSSGAQEQASSLEETASSLEEITGTVQQNADNAQQANQLAGNARDVAEKGGEVVGRAVQSMSEINASSRKIADIITAIDEIAFQTNLLALNAAVEAARAGEQGRGFAVVAGEVRNLAQRSAGAAKEIKGLIQDSVAKVEAGTNLVNQSGHTLNEIVTSVKRVTDIVSEIAAASREQAGGVEQVNRAVTQMDQVTQGNASQTEELAGTAQGLAAQATQLQQLVAQFNLVKKGRTRQAAISAAPAAAAPTVKRTAPVAKKRTSAKPAAKHDDSLENQVERELDMLGVGAGDGRSAGFEEF
jgi:uncharacterized protein Yka (UPF0111/DUF47 family)